jgi:hypothetical protein
MNTPTKVAGFALGLLAVFGAATGIGALAGPVRDAPAMGAPSAEAAHDTGGHADGPTTGSAAAEPELPGGLMVSQDGYTLDLAERQLTAGASVPLEFRILGPDDEPVTDYSREHGKDLHLIVVRRDLTGYQHVHPRLAADGTWTVPVQLTRGGVYRVFADFTPTARSAGLTLGADLSVPGRYDPRPLPASSRTAQVDGYAVTLDGTLAAGQESELTLSVSRGGRPVTDLQPYLEAYGHLVALRDRDLAYLHVHPIGAPDDGRTAAGPGITFRATAPSNGDYRLFLDFRHDDRVRTAEFSVSTGTGTPGGPEAGTPGPGAGTPGPGADPSAGHDAEPPAGHDHGSPAAPQPAEGER